MVSKSAGDALTWGERVGATIREHRERAGLTQHELAHRLAVSDSYLSRMERGFTGVPKPRLMEKLVSADIGLTLGKLYRAAGRVSSVPAEQEPASSWIDRFLREDAWLRDELEQLEVAWGADQAGLAADVARLRREIVRLVRGHIEDARDGLR